MIETMSAVEVKLKFKRDAFKYPFFIDWIEYEGSCFSFEQFAFNELAFFFNKLSEMLGVKFILNKIENIQVDEDKIFLINKIDDDIKITDFSKTIYQCKVGEKEPIRKAFQCLNCVGIDYSIQ